MKIVHVTPYIFPAMAYGGPAKLVYQLAMEQQRQNNSVAIVTSDSFNEKRRFTQKEKSSLNKNIKIFFSKNIVNNIAYKNRLFTHFGIIKKIILNLKNYEIYHIHDIYILPQILLMYILIIFKKTYIISPHGVLDPTRTKRKQNIKNIFFQLVKPCFKKAEQIIATSDQERDYLKNIFPNLKNKITTIWNGIEDSGVSIEKSSSGKIRLLYIGKLHPQKGLCNFIEALGQFPNYKNIFELTIAGPDDGDEENINKLIKRLDIDIKKIGFVDENRKTELYESNDIFIHPSESEGFSISIIEALSHGLPIFVTKFCNFKKTDLVNSGFLIQNNSIEEIIVGLNKINKNRSKLLLFSKNAKKLFIKKYTIEIMAKNISNILKKSFFGIELLVNSSNKLFVDSFNLYFPKKFNALYPILNASQSVSISFNFNKKINKNDLQKTQLSQFINLNNDNLWVQHNYLSTETKINFIFNNENISKIDIEFNSSYLFEISNLILNNLLKKNLLKQIIKTYIQHPLLLNIANQNNLNCLHASAIEKNGQIIAFMGMNGVGKSSLVANYVNEKSYKLFSDSYLLFSSNGNCYRYPSYIRLSKQQIKKNNLITTSVFGYEKNNSTIKLSRKKEASLKKVYILQRGNKDFDKKITSGEAIDLIRNLQAIDQEEIRFSVIQLKLNNFKPIKFNKNTKFYIRTIRNNE